jgi:RimJ/RimL family protein N-acetyltransferase
MKSLEETELQFRSEEPKNYPGFDSHLHFRPMKITDTAIMTPVLKSSAKSIRGYLGQFQQADLWDIRDAKNFVAKCVNAEFPSFHYLFFIGSKLVGMGSLHQYGDSPLDVQIVLAVFGEYYQGRGIGAAIGTTLMRVAFDVWGFRSFWWLVDATNRASIRTAQKVGLQIDHHWEDSVKHSQSESGLWWAFKADRPDGLAAGILQGASIEYWGEAKNASLLAAVIAAQKIEG